MVCWKSFDRSLVSRFCRVRAAVAKSQLMERNNESDTNESPTTHPLVAHFERDADATRGEVILGLT